MLKKIEKFPAGVVDIPCSKSLAHRVMICSALASLHSGRQIAIPGINFSKDLRATADCLNALGFDLKETKNLLLISGGRRRKSALLNCGDSASTLRFLLPIAPQFAENCVFKCSEGLMNRPAEEYFDQLEKNDLILKKSATEIEVFGKLLPGTYFLPGGISSQFVSGLLFALPLLGQSSRIIIEGELESLPYVKMTLAVLKIFGIRIQHEGFSEFFVRGNQEYEHGQAEPEGDYSQAAFFLAAGALGCPVSCRGLKKNSLQGDEKVLDIMKQMGCRFEEKNGALRAVCTELRATEIDAKNIPDLVPPLAVLCAVAKGQSRIINAGRLRHKESDRLNALFCGLNALGADVVQKENELTINGKKSLKGGQVSACGDHRIAMAMALAAIACSEPVYLSGAEQVEKSYPAFWSDFEKE